MKKAFTKKIVTLLTVLTLAFCYCTMSFAAEIPTVETTVESTISADSNGGISPHGNSYEGGGIGANSSEWTTIATSTNGFGCTVQVNVNGTGRVSIQMLGQNNDKLWSETGALGLVGSRQFYCGTDVHKIQVKCVSGYSRVSCWPVN